MTAAIPSTMTITPATWETDKLTLQKTGNGLFRLVGWYGSTHAAAMWRKDPQFLAVFEQHHMHGFDPQVEGWAPAYALIEAEVLATACVVIIRLENNELIEGSLGSIAEIGMALTSAALRGQSVVVSIEDGLLTSLSEPGSIAQYMIIEMFLEHWEKSPDLAGLLTIHRGDDLAHLAALACRAAEQQMHGHQGRIDFEEFLMKKARRKHNFPMRVLLGGSGGPYTEAHQESFERKKQTLIAPYLAEGQMVKVLSEGAIADAWKIPYGSVDNLGVALATRTLLSIESEYKQEADVLLLPIMSEAASKGAVTEIGLLLLNALFTGQWVKIYMELFDPVDYVRHQFDDVAVISCTTEKDMRNALHQAGVDDAILALAVQGEIGQTFDVFQTLMRGQQPTFRQLKKSLLGKTDAFHAADNIRRVRTLAQAHLERLADDPRFDGFFSYATEIEQ